MTLRIIITHARTSWQVSGVKEIEHILACGIVVTNVTSTRPGLRDKTFVHRSSEGNIWRQNLQHRGHSCTATNQVSTLWITVLKNQSLWQIHLVWMGFVNQSLNLRVVRRQALEHKLPTATALCCLKSGRWVWRCWAASKVVAWRKTSQELPLQMRFNWKLEPLESLEIHHKPKFDGLWWTRNCWAAQLLSISLYAISYSHVLLKGTRLRSLRLEGSARISTHRSWRNTSYHLAKRPSTSININIKTYNLCPWFATSISIRHHSSSWSWQWTSWRQPLRPLRSRGQRPPKRSWGGRNPPINRRFP